jgi:hypothetical protein
MALKRVWIPSPNYSSRGGAGVRLIVIHTAEGARTIESLGSWFQNPTAGCSSQTGADDKANTVGEYVSRSNKAWTQANYNPVATSIELCGFAAWSTGEWDAHPNMLDNCAKWVAEEAAHFGIPITKLTDSQAQGSGRGVCQHADLGAGGGGHWDCGSGFPIDRVLDMARGGAGGSPTTEGDEMIASCVAANGNFHVFEADGKNLGYTYQREGETAWAGGVQGKGPAGWSKLATADAEIVGVSAEVSAVGVMHVFVRCANGKTYYTYQRKNETAWSGGEAGKQIAGLAYFAG